MTDIKYNGSRFAGGSPDTIDQLCDLLMVEPLDPNFEKYGDFVYRTGGGAATLTFFGNFFHVSHAFRIDTDEQPVIDKLIAHIKANKDSQAYKDAKAERRAGNGTFRSTYVNAKLGRR